MKVLALFTFLMSTMALAQVSNPGDTKHEDKGLVDPWGEADKVKESKAYRGGNTGTTCASGPAVTNASGQPSCSGSSAKTSAPKKYNKDMVAYVIGKLRSEGNVSGDLWPTIKTSTDNLVNVNAWVRATTKDPATLTKLELGYNETLYSDIADALNGGGKNSKALADKLGITFDATGKPEGKLAGYDASAERVKEKGSDFVADAPIATSTTMVAETKTNDTKVEAANPNQAPTKYADAYKNNSLAKSQSDAYFNSEISKLTAERDHNLRMGNEAEAENIQKTIAVFEKGRDVTNNAHNVALDDAKKAKEKESTDWYKNEADKAEVAGYEKSFMDKVKSGAVPDLSTDLGRELYVNTRLYQDAVARGDQKTAEAYKTAGTSYVAAIKATEKANATNNTRAPASATPSAK